VAVARKELLDIATPEYRTDRSEGPGLNQAIATAVVRAHKRHLGRGPTRAQAFFHQNMIVVLIEDGVTEAERTLTARGHGEEVRSMRRRMLETTRDDVVEEAERLTGRRVQAFLCDVNMDPDVAMELLLLDRPVAEAR
jgi:uncharacterized protein YbcI